MTERRAPYASGTPLMLRLNEDLHRVLEDDEQRPYLSRRRTRFEAGTRFLVTADEGFDTLYVRLPEPVKNQWVVYGARRADLMPVPTDFEIAHAFIEAIVSANVLDKYKRELRQMFDLRDQMAEEIASLKASLAEAVNDRSILLRKLRAH